jgi:hypothetical protein
MVPCMYAEYTLVHTYRRFGAGGSRWFLALGLFYPEDGGDTFLRNVG